tara:strand:+ start:178 stop:525 length:348 start_codon:yes stop_codon:yes gene_type:complete
MDEGTVGLVLGLCVACVAFLAWRIERQGYALQAKVDETAAKIEAKTHPDIPDFGELREDLEDLITETIGSMRTPQIADHIGAVLAQWAQVKMHKEMQAMQMVPTLADAIQPEPDQ